MENVSIEFEIMEAFQKTEAYKTVTKGKDVYPLFRDGWLACYNRPTETCANNEPKIAVDEFDCIKNHPPKIPGHTLPGLAFR